MPDNVDIAACKVLAKIEDLPSLKVRKSDVTLYEEVAMCVDIQEDRNL